jgi:predicted Zn-dependent protease
MRLAEVLLADGQLAEARTYFMTLGDRSPGSGEVNLGLAHVSAQASDSSEAIRYFQAAIYGSWEKDPAEQRGNARLELCEFLLSQGRTSEAQAQLTALAADAAPDDVTLLEKTGQMFLRAGEPKKALEEFETALRSDPGQPRMMENAGEAAFAAADYSKAEKYLAPAESENPSDAVAEMLATARTVTSEDPFQPALSDAQQAGRSWRAFQHGIERLQQCAGPNAAARSEGQPLSEMQNLVADSLTLKKSIHMDSLIKDPELRKQAMQFVFQVEETTAKSCGTPAAMDRALLLMKKKYEANIP